MIVARKNEKRIVEILFLPQHFHHLLGLHKLTDIPMVSKRAANTVYREILTGKIKYDDIKRSCYICQMTDRLTHYEDIFNILNVKSLFFRSLHGYFKGVNAECVICKSFCDGNFAFLFLAKHQNVYFPCSFFLRNENREYTKDGTRWNIISVNEITK